MGWLVGLGVTGFLLFMVAVSMVRIRITYQRNRTNDHLRLYLRMLYGCVRFQFQVPFLDMQTNRVETKVKMKNKDGDVVVHNGYSARLKTFMQIINRQHLQEIISMVDLFFSKVMIHHFDLRVQVGTGEASDTGKLTGFMWSIYYLLIGWLSRHVILQDKPSCHIQPLFQEKKLHIDGTCIVQFRLGHAIRMGIRLTRYVIKSKRGSAGRRWIKNILSRA